MRDKIKLESGAGTGHFYTLPKINALCPANWKSKNSIRLPANT